MDLGVIIWLCFVYWWGNPIHCTFIFTFLCSCYLRVFLPTVRSNTNNFQRSIWPLYETLIDTTPRVWVGLGIIAMKGHSTLTRSAFNGGINFLLPEPWTIMKVNNFRNILRPHEIGIEYILWSMSSIKYIGQYRVLNTLVNVKYLTLWSILSIQHIDQDQVYNTSVQIKYSSHWSLPRIQHISHYQVFNTLVNTNYSRHWSISNIYNIDQYQVFITPVKITYLIHWLILSIQHKGLCSITKTALF